MESITGAFIRWGDFEASYPTTNEMIAFLTLVSFAFICVYLHYFIVMARLKRKV